MTEELGGNIISQMSYKMTHNRVPQIAQPNSNNKNHSMVGGKESGVAHPPTRSQVANQIAQRKVRSATRASDIEPPRQNNVVG